MSQPYSHVASTLQSLVKTGEPFPVKKVQLKFKAPKEKGHG